MNIDEIKRNAPDGATHYQTIPVLSYLKIDDSWSYTWFSHLKKPDWVKFFPVCVLDYTNIKPL